MEQVSTTQSLCPPANSDSIKKTIESGTKNKDTAMKMVKKVDTVLNGSVVQSSNA